jgi:hypothetical protein
MSSTNDGNTFSENNHIQLDGDDVSLVRLPSSTNDDTSSNEQQQQQHQVSQLVRQSIITETFFCNDIMTSIARFLTWTDILSLRVALGIVDCRKNDDKNTIHARCISHDISIQRTNIIPLKTIMDVRMERNYSFTKLFASIYVDVMDTIYMMLHESVETCLSMNNIMTLQPELKHVLTTHKEQFTKLQPTTTAHVVVSHHRHAANTAATNSTFYDKDNFCELTSWIPASFITYATTNDQTSIQQLLFQQNMYPFDMQFTYMSEKNQYERIWCRNNNRLNTLGKYRKTTSLPYSLIDNKTAVVMLWDQPHTLVDFDFQKLVDASKSEKAYQPMPYRLGNPKCVCISRVGVFMEQNNYSNIIGDAGFCISWNVPISTPLSDDDNDNSGIKYVTLQITSDNVRWTIGQYSDDDILTKIGLLRPSEISIKQGCLILKWVLDITLNYQFTELKFHNTGGITETFRICLCDPIKRYFSPNQITDSQSYKLFPWFNDVYNRMDIFSCGLCPHTTSICGKDYAIVIRFCFAKTSQDILNPPLPPPQERQLHTQVVDQPRFDVCKKYPAYFHLVPLD